MGDREAILVAALADRYLIEAGADGRPSVLGEGGMATVYLATDLRHNRKVAASIVVADLKTGRFTILPSLSGFGSPLRWSRDGSLLASARRDNEIVRWSENQARWSRVSALERKRLSPAVSGDGRLIACSGSTTRPDVWVADQPGRSGW